MLHALLSAITIPNGIAIDIAIDIDIDIAIAIANAIAMATTAVPGRTTTTRPSLKGRETLFFFITFYLCFFIKIVFQCGRDIDCM